jgi:hypothetical protein
MHNQKNLTSISQSKSSHAKDIAQMHKPKNSTLISQSKGTQAKAETEMKVKLGKRPLVRSDRALPLFIKS